MRKRLFSISLGFASFFGLQYTDCLWHDTIMILGMGAVRKDAFINSLKVLNRLSILLFSLSALTIFISSAHVHDHSKGRFFACGWHPIIQPYPSMGQANDIAHAIQVWRATGCESAEGNRVGGHSMGAGIAAHAIAYRYIHKPLFLLYVAGYSHGKDVIQDFTGTRYVGDCGLSLYAARSLLFRNYDPAPTADHPVKSLCTIAATSDLPIVFLHSEDDAMVPVTHAYENYLATVKARGNNKGIYLIVEDGLDHNNIWGWHS